MVRFQRERLRVIHERHQHGGGRETAQKTSRQESFDAALNAVRRPIDPKRLRPMEGKHCALVARAEGQRP